MFGGEAFANKTNNLNTFHFGSSPRKKEPKEALLPRDDLGFRIISTTHENNKKNPHSHKNRIFSAFSERRSYS